MWKFFANKPKTAHEIVKSLRESLHEARTQDDPRTIKKLQEDVSKSIHTLKVMLFGDPSNDVEVRQQDVTDIVRLAACDDFLILIANNLSLMEFETRKDAVQIFQNLLRRDADETSGRSVIEKVAERNGEVLRILTDGYDNGDIALNCGAILRECIRNEDLTHLMLTSGQFWRFFGLVELNDFDVASDAFSTFKECLVRHVPVSASFIEANRDEFITKYNQLLQSSNYVNRRQSLKLLGEMFIERVNQKIMIYYIASADNLRVIMNLLLDRRRNIQFEAFHVFKIFVANPRKSKVVLKILILNKQRMLKFLEDFLSDHQDEQFQDDRRKVLRKIHELPDSEESIGVA